MAERRAPCEPGRRRRRVESVRASRTPGEPARGFGYSAPVIRYRARQAVARPVRRSPNARGCDGGPRHVGASSLGRPHLVARPCGHRRPPAVRDAASATKRNYPGARLAPRAAHASPGMTMERRTKDARPRTSPRWWAPAGLEDRIREPAGGEGGRPRGRPARDHRKRLRSPGYGRAAGATAPSGIGGRQREPDRPPVLRRISGTSFRPPSLPGASFAR